MSAKKRGLGRGLDALLGPREGGTPVNVAAVAQPLPGEVLRKVRVTELQPGRYQPRREMDPARLEELAERHRLPVIGTGSVPVTPTREFPSTFLPPGPWPRWLNRPGHVLATRQIWRQFRRPLDAARAHRLGLPPQRRPLPEAPFLYGFSPALLPAPGRAACGTPSWRALARVPASASTSTWWPAAIRPRASITCGRVSPSVP